MQWQELADDLEPFLTGGKIEHCIEKTNLEINSEPKTAFRIGSTLDFSNQPNDIADHIARFVDANPSIQTIYCEMNGFYINPDRWYFELFGYKKHLEDNIYDALAHADFKYAETITLKGMEKLQAVYAKEQVSETKNLCDLLVLYKFMLLIQKSSAHLKVGNKKIIATAHEYDIFFIAMT